MNLFKDAVEELETFTSTGITSPFFRLEILFHHCHLFAVIKRVSSFNQVFGSYIFVNTAFGIAQNCIFKNSFLCFETIHRGQKPCVINIELKLIIVCVCH